MKIAQISPGILPIPPKKWGAIEEIIWQYKLNFEKLGHDVDVIYADQAEPNMYDIVHLHVGRFAKYSDHLDGGLHQRGVEYIFTMHDVSSYMFGKHHPIYKQNEEAIINSLFSTVGCKAFRNIFSFDCCEKIEWLLHGADTDFFSCSPFSGEHKILCVGAKENRKQFHLAVESAKILNLPITIVGPERDKHYCDNYLNSINYNKLTLINNSDKNELKNIHKDHSILIHPSICETGNPCLAVMEAMSSGLPVVGTNMDSLTNFKQDRFPDMHEIPGFIHCFQNSFDIAEKIKLIINNYDNYQKQARLFALNNSWEKVCQRIIDLHQYHTLKNKLFKYV